MAFGQYEAESVQKVHVVVLPAAWPASVQIAPFGVAFWREKGQYPAGARPLIWLALLHPLRCGFWLAALSLSITYVWRSLICVFLSV